MEQFVTVRHTDGRTADITAAEVAYYGTLGFAPVDGAAVPAGDGPTAAPAPLAAPANGTDQRLDLVLEELRALRAALSPGARESAEADGEAVELREPGVEAMPVAKTSLGAMNREELNAHAATVGIDDPAAFSTKAELIAAIEAGAGPA